MIRGKVKVKGDRGKAVRYWLHITRMSLHQGRRDKEMSSRRSERSEKMRMSEFVSMCDGVHVVVVKLTRNMKDGH